jgi:hypothetical protein
MLINYQQLAILHSNDGLVAAATLSQPFHQTLLILRHLITSHLIAFTPQLITIFLIPYINSCIVFTFIRSLIDVWEDQ